MKTYIVGTHYKHLSEAFLKSTHNIIMFPWRITKISIHFVEVSALSGAVGSFQYFLVKKIRKLHLTLQGIRSIQGPVVQSIVSLTSSLRVISLIALADSLYSIPIFFDEKM